MSDRLVSALFVVGIVATFALGIAVMVLVAP